MTFDLSGLTVGDLVRLQRALLENNLEGALEVLEKYIPDVRELRVADFFPALREALERLIPKM